MPYFGNNPSPLLLNTVAQNGKEMTLDADADTSITADTDDQIDIKIGGADDFQFTANTFTAQSGSTIATNTISETTSGSGVTIDSVLLKDGGIDVNGNEIILDADADTSITADTDDQIDIKIAGADDFQFTANTFTAQSGSTIAAQALTATTITATGDISFNGGDFVFNESGASKDFRVEGDSDANLLLADGSADRVGIGLATPLAKLDVNGTTDAELRITRQFATVSASNTDQGAVLHLFNDINFENGYNGAASVGQIIFSSDDDSTGQGIRSKIACSKKGYGHTETLDFYVSPNNTTSNQVSATSNSTSKHVSIFGGGCTIFNYSVSGRTEPAYTTRAFEAYSTADNISSAVIHNKSTGSYPAGISVAYDGTPDDQDQYAYYFFDGTAARFLVFNDGDVRNHDNSYGALSDERIKQDIVDSNSQWNDIKNIKVRNFKRKDDVAQYGDKAWSQIGVVAQEVETVCPNIIRESNPTPEDIKMSAEFGTLYTQTDKDNDDIPEGKQIGDVKEVKSKVKSIGYSVLYMKAVKALQEAMERIETLEAKVKTLEEA